jgi:hypothetical protein
MKKIFGISAIAGTVAVVGMSLGAASASAGGCGYANGWEVEAAGSASCGFALNVAQGISTAFSGSGRITAYSPATGLNYNVMCERPIQAKVQCWGGNGAVINLWSPLGGSPG